MADTILQAESVPATPSLADDLARLEDRVRRMETLLRGAESILSAIRYDGDLSYTPANGEHVSGHRRACDLIEFLGEQITQWRSSETELDFAADDLCTLKDMAEGGRIARMKHYPEPALELVDSN